MGGAKNASGRDTKTRSMNQELRIDVPELKLVGEFFEGVCPRQAEGTVANHPFYFRARHASWTFSLSMDPSLHPLDIAFPNNGLCPGIGFFREENYGTGFDAGYMPIDEARQIIIQCAQQILLFDI